MTNKDKALGMTVAALGSMAAILLLILWAGFWSGLTVSVLWGWFIVPLGAPAIGLWHAYGLALIWSAFSGLGRKGRDDNSGMAQVLVQVPLAGCVLMGSAWVIKGWM